MLDGVNNSTMRTPGKNDQAFSLYVKEDSLLTLKSVGFDLIAAFYLLRRRHLLVARDPLDISGKVRTRDDLCWGFYLHNLQSKGLDIFFAQLSKVCRFSCAGAQCVSPGKGLLAHVKWRPCRDARLILLRILTGRMSVLRNHSSFTMLPNVFKRIS